MFLPLVNVQYPLMAAVLFFFSFRLHQSYKKTANLISKYFRNTTFYSGFASVIYALMTILFPHNSLALGIGNVLGEPFFMVGFVYMIATFFHMTFPQVSQKKVITVGIFIVVLTFVSHLYFFPYPFIDKNGILQFNAPIIPGLTFSIFSTVAYLPLLVAFTREAIKKEYLRVRSGLIAGSIIFFFVSGVIQSIVSDPFIYAFSFVLQISASALLFFSVIARVKEAPKE